jgi:predicted phosphodiesterase
MKYFIISDIHSNLEALEAVFEDIGEISPPDKIVCLGDVVGYGPNPNECIELIEERSEFTIMGNHDHAVLGLTSIEYFNPHAIYAILWTRKVLSNRNKKTLETYNKFSLRENHLLFTHATPKDPHTWDYIFSESEAIYHFEGTTDFIRFIGHSHIPISYAIDDQGLLTIERKGAFILSLEDKLRYIINVGSVGQPRDRIPLSAYGVYDVDEKTMQVRRVSYDVEKTQKKMKKVKLPQFLIDRLERGI